MGYKPERHGKMKVLVRCRDSDINVIVKELPAAAQRMFSIFPGVPPSASSSHHPRRAVQPSTSSPRSLLFFCQMATPEQPVDLGVRSNALEQVRCPQVGRVNWFTQTFPCIADIQKGRRGEREEGFGGRDGRGRRSATGDLFAAVECDPGLPTARRWW